MAEKSYKVISETGIQARPAAQLVNLASQFKSDISIRYKSSTVNLKSIMGVMSLAIAKGAVIDIAVNGPDEQDALNKIDHFIKSEIAE
ncbi:phosphocarrier protein HPr [Planococcus halotolerans]|uniref:Phosphocarrier protein HPr n=1 Tax=Planococcus halotolerans TaxID=2233542 RepID=A0A365L6V5_9BACL|nr:phosphocarrier protein HPr [Planococcus halotolerans]RAZ81154.1 phosphocarrier protein HPr [Planococcus halotolerans]